MKIEDPNQENNQKKLDQQSKELGKKEKRSISVLDKLIVILVIGTVTYVGLTFLNCNFMIPGSISKANVLGTLKNPPPLECKESESRGYNALFTLFTALLGLKAKMED